MKEHEGSRSASRDGRVRGTGCRFLANDRVKIRLSREEPPGKGSSRECPGHRANAVLETGIHAKNYGITQPRVRDFEKNLFGPGAADLECAAFEGLEEKDSRLMANSRSPPWPRSLCQVS